MSDERSFYLVQRLKRSPMADWPADDERRNSPLAKIGNPFGYGQMGDYELDYMGAAEFEWGAIPEAQKRLAKARRGLVLGTWTYGGHDLDFLWIKKEGEPYEKWAEWAEGKRVGERMLPPFYGKERPYELERRLNGEEPFGGGWRTDIWWALGANVNLGVYRGWPPPQVARLDGRKGNGMSWKAHVLLIAATVLVCCALLYAAAAATGSPW